MEFLRLILSVSLIIAAATALLVDEDLKNNSSKMIDDRLPDNVVPIHYNIKITPYIEKDNFTFDGEIAASIEFRRATRDLSLHALNLTIDEEATSLRNDDGVVYIPRMHNYNNLTEMLVLKFDDELSPGIYVLNMKFVGILHGDARGFFRTSYKNEEKRTV